KKEEIRFFCCQRGPFRIEVWGRRPGLPRTEPLRTPRGGRIMRLVCVTGPWPWAAAALAGLAAAAGPAAAQALTRFDASGANAAAIQSTVTAFRTALGGNLNPNIPGFLVGGRREIN